MAENDTTQQIADGCTDMIRNGTAQRQRLETVRAQIEVKHDLAVAAYWVGEEITARKYGVLDHG